MSAMMMEKIMVVAPTTAVPISTGLAVALKVLPSAVVLFQQVFGAIEVDVNVDSPSSVPPRCSGPARSTTAHTPIARCP